MKDAFAQNTNGSSVSTPALQDEHAGPACTSGSAQPRGAKPVDRGEFAAACGEYLDQVWRQLRAMGVRECYLDDATQEVFLIAFGKLGSFEGRAKLSTWLYAIAYRVGCNYRRKARREAALESIEIDYEGSGQDPEQSLVEKQAADLVQRFCDGLSVKLRDVFVLCILEGQPVPSVAILLQLPENTVHSRIRLVREAFRSELAARQKAAP